MASPLISIVLTGSLLSMPLIFVMLRAGTWVTTRILHKFHPLPNPFVHARTQIFTGQAATAIFVNLMAVIWSSLLTLSRFQLNRAIVEAGRNHQMDIASIEIKPDKICDDTIPDESAWPRTNLAPISGIVFCDDDVSRDQVYKVMLPRLVSRVTNLKSLFRTMTSIRFYFSRF